jgi:hypothetical protein
MKANGYATVEANFVGVLIKDFLPIHEKEVSICFHVNECHKKVEFRVKESFCFKLEIGRVILRIIRYVIK